MKHTQGNYGLHEMVLVNIEGNWEKAIIDTRYKNYCSVYSVELVKNTYKNKYSASMVSKWYWLRCPYDHIKAEGKESKRITLSGNFDYSQYDDEEYSHTDEG